MCYNITSWMTYISSSCEKKLCTHSTTAPIKRYEQKLFVFLLDYFIWLLVYCENITLYKKQNATFDFWIDEESSNKLRIRWKIIFKFNNIVSDIIPSNRNNISIFSTIFFFFQISFFSPNCKARSMWWSIWNFCFR